MNFEEFFKRSQETFAELGITVTRDNPSPEELQRTIFLFPPKARPSAMSLSHASATISEKAENKYPQENHLSD
jgi:hypothetical protein